MSEFDDLRTRLAGARAAKADAASKLAATREQLKGVERKIDALKRVGDRERAKELAALEKEAEALAGEVRGLRDEVAKARADAGALLGQLVAIADPAEQIAKLDDRLPILLFPLRLEIRFHRPEDRGPRSRAIAPPGPELWIRIWPDDCQVDSFEELLSDADLRNVQAFWIAMWRAGGVEAQERGAWRALVGGVGSGRAAYLIGQYRPSNPGDRPAKVDPQDVVLVIAPQIDVTAAERAAAVTYFTAVWRADGDLAKEQAALAALQADVGAARAAELRAGFAPDAAGQEPPLPYTRNQVRVSCAVIEFPAAPPTKTTAWTQAPRAAALPDRFVALLSSGGQQLPPVFGNPIPDDLAVGPDPSLPQDQQIRAEDGDIVLNYDLRWLADFERAVEVGMAIRVPLTAEQAQVGFDRLLVVGLRLSSDAADAKQRLETLIGHHYASRRGFGIAVQGAATNNTGTDDSAYTWIDDPDGSFDAVFKGKEAYTETDDPLQRADGQWLAEALGIDSALVKRIPNAAGLDQAEARAMNVALWPATLGYWLEEMMTPLFDRYVAPTRAFFTRYVSGRGPLPAVRVGRQPYGILPATAFSRYRPLDRRGEFGTFELPAADGNYLARLHALLERADADWRAVSRNVAHAAAASANPTQTMLDIVGLHSGSVEYHQRYAESFDQLYNKLVLEFGQTLGAILARWLASRGRQLLTQLGGDPDAQPPILEKFFYGKSTLLTGPVVDDVPLSESARVRGYAADGKNYLEWLATSSLEKIRIEDFGGNPAPTALLYLFLRHAMMLGHWDAGIRFLEGRALVESATVRREPSFVHVAEEKSGSESKFRHLYEPKPEVTGSSTKTLAEYVREPGVLGTTPETADLSETIAALEFLKDRPTARLERAFADHVDCCTYRLDAWKSGIVATRLEELRSGGGAVAGLYLGAFGWLENLRPKLGRLEDVTLDEDLAAVFERPTDAPLRHDPANAGYIHAPSLNHGAAAGILKNAYRVHASPANPDAMAVNLTSARVRRALSVLEGIRNGQTLAALLGYFFERALHDAHDLAEVDKFIYPLRQVFPLVANQLATTADPDADIRLLEARNVIDGVKLVERMKTPGNRSYPFGFPVGTGPGQLPQASQGEQLALDTEAGALADLYDAVADLVLAESVYQVVLGNFDRAAANTNAFSKGGHPPETRVVDTPRTGVSLTHRVALHLDPAADPAVSPNAVPMSPRAKAEAPLASWLAGRLPAPDDVVVSVRYSSPVLPALKTVTVSQTGLGLQPIDLLYLVNLDLEQAMSELDDRIVQAIRYGPDAHPGLAVEIAYTKPVPDKVTLFELAALVRSLRPLLLESRPLGPTDLVMPLEPRGADVMWDDAELAGRVTAAIGSLTTLKTNLAALETDASDLDAYARKVSDAFLELALHGIPQTGTGQIHDDIRLVYDALAAKVREFVTRWTQKAADYQTLLDTWPALTTDEERFALLRKAEGIVSSSTTPTPPANVGTYRTQVEAKKGDFDTRLGELRDLLTFSTNKLTEFAAEVDAMTAKTAPHDAVPLDVAAQKQAITDLRATLVSRVKSAVADLGERLDKAATAAAAPTTAMSSQARVEQLLGAARQVLGDEIALVPRFTLAHDPGIEFEHCLSGSDALLTDLKADGRRFPVDDWLYGLARVRAKLGAWENAAVLSEAFGADRAELTPVQLPLQADDRWTALEFDTSKIANDRLVYTAHFAAPFQRMADQCGLLLDEWPEVVPAKDLVSGVTFHFDRPPSQPAQTMLLAVSPQLTGSWRWDDLVATLNETLDAGKARLVEPAQIDASAYAQFLPATLMAVTLYLITISTNLAANNNVYDRLRM